MSCLVQLNHGWSLGWAHWDWMDTQCKPNAKHHLAIVDTFTATAWTYIFTCSRVGEGGISKLSFKGLCIIILSSVYHTTKLHLPFFNCDRLTTLNIINFSSVWLCVIVVRKRKMKLLWPHASRWEKEYHGEQLSSSTMACMVSLLKNNIMLLLEGCG